MLKFIPRQRPHIEKGEIRTLFAGLYRQRLLAGPAIEKFETSFAEFLGANQACASASARGALNLILDCLDLKKGDEIIVPGFNFYIVPAVIAQRGLVPVFADCEPGGFNLDVEEFERAITENTRAVIVTHLFGKTCRLNEIKEIARSRNICVIEDCAQALGTAYHGSRAGSFGDAAFFSFSGGKIIDTVEGGMAIANTGVMSKRLKEIKARREFPSMGWIIAKFLKKYLLWMFMNPVFLNFVVYPALYVCSLFTAKDIIYELLREKRDKTPDTSGNLWTGYTNFQAQLALRQLPEIDKRVDKCRMIAGRYSSALKGLRSRQKLKWTESKDTSSCYQFVVRTPAKDAVYRKLLRGGVDAQKQYCENCEGLPQLKRYSRNCKRAKEAQNQVLHIPLRWNMNEREIRHVCREISSI